MVQILKPCKWWTYSSLVQFSNEEAVVYDINGCFTPNYKKKSIFSFTSIYLVMQNVLVLFIQVWDLLTLKLKITFNKQTSLWTVFTLYWRNSPYKTLTVCSVDYPEFQGFEHHQQHSIHVHCFVMETEISETNISKSGPIKPKLSVWLDTMRGECEFFFFHHLGKLKSSKSTFIVALLRPGHGTIARPVVLKSLDICVLKPVSLLSWIIDTVLFRDAVLYDRWRSHTVALLCECKAPVKTLFQTCQDIQAKLLAIPS